MESYTPWLVRTPVSVQINKLSRLDHQPGRELSRHPLKVIKKPPSTRASPNVWSYAPLLKISLELQICQIPLQRLKSSPARGLLVFSDFGASAFPANRKERKLAHHAIPVSKRKHPHSQINFRFWRRKSRGLGWEDLRATLRCQQDFYLTVRTCRILLC